MVTASGYCYPDTTASSTTSNIQSLHMGSHLQGFDHNPEIYNLTTGMEMIGFPHKNLPQPQTDQTSSVVWRGFFNKPENIHPCGGGPSSSKSINDQPSLSEFYTQHDYVKPDISTDHAAANESLAVAPVLSTTAWHEHNRFLVEDPSTLRCVFPCEGNEKPSQGLSLSLSSSHPSSIGFQSFELRQQHDYMRFLASSSKNDFFSKPLNVQSQQQMMQDGLLGKAANIYYQSQFLIRHSKYLLPAQELLNEFCSLETKQTRLSSKIKLRETHQWQEENASSSTKKQCLYSLDVLELQKRKSKLLQMLEEVDRRYKNYCDQMKAVISSFEAVAGNGAARVYSALASRAMSRHFRCLRDAISGQIKATKKAMGDKDSVAPGTTRGETPRLRILDQTLRQQRALQQMSMMESHPWRPQRGLPERSVSVLRAWLFEHFLHPYPSDVDKHTLARQTGLSRSQVSNWFINARVRLWKPMVEEMYLEELKEQENIANPMEGIAAAAAANGEDKVPNTQNQNIPHQLLNGEDQKPKPDQLLIRIDAESISSIINDPEKNESRNGKRNYIQEAPHVFRAAADSISGMQEFDFSSYNHGLATVQQPHLTNNQSISHRNYGGHGGGVSLTLGLQQHGGNGVSLAFSPASQGSLFYPRDHHIEECQQVQYSLFENEGQNLPYRNLMGAQLLHDLAG